MISDERPLGKVIADDGFAKAVDFATECFVAIVEFFVESFVSQRTSFKKGREMFCSARLAFVSPFIFFFCGLA
jgi:primase-polymerase (primpol)-like protein